MQYLHKNGSMIIIIRQTFFLTFCVASQHHQFLQSWAKAVRDNASCTLGSRKTAILGSTFKSRKDKQGDKAPLLAVKNKDLEGGVMVHMDGTIQL